MKRVWMATATLCCVLVIGGSLAEGCFAQCCESKPNAPPAENKAKQVFMREVPAQLKAQIDEKISEVRKKKPLSDEKAAQVREAVKKGGRTDAKGNPNDAMVTVSSTGLAGLPVIADYLVSEDDTLRLRAMFLLPRVHKPHEFFDEEYDTQTEPLLVLLLRRSLLDSNPRVRALAVGQLYRIGRERHRAIPEGVKIGLEEAQLKDPDPEVREAAYKVRQTLGLVPRDTSQGIMYD